MQEITIANLAWRNIQRRPFRSCCLIIIIMLFSATLFGGSVLMKNLSLGISGMANRLGADILIVPYGYEKNLEVALLRGEPSSFYLKADLIDKIKDIKGIEAVSPQLFIASLSAGCCTSKVQLIGFDQQSDFVIKPWLQTQLEQPLQDDQVVVGSKITSNVGDEIKFFNHPFKIAAKMDSTGMGFDTSVFMTIPAAHSLMKEANLIEGDTDHFANYVSSIFVKVDPDYQSKDIVNQIMPKYAIDYNIDFVMTKGMLSNISKWLNGFSTIVYSLSAIFWVLAIIVIFVIFSSSLNERKREISLLRILGASRSDLVKMLLRESLIISALGGLTGIVVAGVLIYAFSLLICQTIGLPCMNISITDGLIYAFIVFLLTLIIGPLSSIYSALSLTKFDTYQTLREGE
ncbi:MULTISPECIES: ABC transporter permease [unclassified Gilliamella]|uniref:ABC transporter permease n=1 Tax=unclassified Gilliamella TaxID=2685620 RepID=UPI00226AEED0|nr:MULTISPECIES: ABC transporter permease [unclassified Gilliamella]MCX8585572.1 ABC transporter permease [Gilliamella sp. B3562]MCX8685483.1 ABC transporter permease [Gilliamella sp. B2864]